MSWMTPHILSKLANLEVEEMEEDEVAGPESSYDEAVEECTHEPSIGEEKEASGRLANLIFNKYALCGDDHLAKGAEPDVRLQEQHKEPKMLATDEGLRVTEEASGLNTRNQQLNPEGETPDIDKVALDLASLEKEAGKQPSYLGWEDLITLPSYTVGAMGFGDSLKRGVNAENAALMGAGSAGALLAQYLKLRRMFPQQQQASKDQLAEIRAKKQLTDQDKANLTVLEDLERGGELDGDIHSLAGKGAKNLLGKKAAALMIIRKSTGKLPMMDPCCCPEPEDMLPGGKADGQPDDNFVPEDLEQGRTHEMEHTDDPQVAEEIAKDHLAEDNMYYEKLPQIEKSAKNQALDEMRAIIERSSRRG